MNIILSQLNFIIVFFIFLISIYIIIYSLTYFKNDINLNKFIALIMFFTVSMLLCIISSNWLLFFIGWELLGIISFLLINFWDIRTEANKSSLKALLWNKIGDISLLCAIIILWFLFKTYSFIIHLLLVNYLNLKIILFVILILIAIFIKSVQFIFNIWILDAMEGLTPVSAFFIFSYNGNCGSIFSYDIKAILASFTSGQIGYMFLAIGNFYNW